MADSFDLQFHIMKSRDNVHKVKIGYAKELLLVREESEKTFKIKFYIFSVLGLFLVCIGMSKWIAYEKKADKILEEQIQKSPTVIQYFSSMKNKKVPNRKRRIN